VIAGHINDLDLFCLTRLIPGTEKALFQPQASLFIGILPIVTHHLKRLFGDMLRDGGDELSGCVYSEVFLVIAVGHLCLVYDSPGFIVVEDIGNRKGIADYILGDPLPCLVVVSCNPYGTEGHRSERSRRSYLKYVLSINRRIGLLKITAGELLV